MRTRTQLFLGAAAIGVLLTGANAQTMREGQPRAGDQRQQVDRIQDTNRKAEPQSSAQPQQQGTQPQQQGTAQPQQGTQQSPRTVYPNTQTGQNQPAQPAQGNTQSNPQSGAQPSPSQPQQPSAATRQQPSGQTGTTAAPPPAQSQPAQSAQPQSAPSQAQPAQRPAQQPTQSGQRSSSSGVVSLNTQQQTQIGRTIARSNVRPLTNVNFSIAVGTRVPTSVRLRALPADLVTFAPQYRGYSYFVVEEQVVIVEPSTHEIVTIMPYTGSKAATRRDKPMTSRPVKLNTEQRDVVRRGATERRSSTVRKRYVSGDRIDREVTIESFPETVYTEVPSIRRYRYFRDDADVFLVDPDEDRVVDVIR